jgi:hypothetical protein
MGSHAELSTRRARRGTKGAKDEQVLGFAIFVPGFVLFALKA